MSTSPPASRDARSTNPDTSGLTFEWWARVGLALVGVAVVNWVVIYLRLGEPSVIAHAFLTPAIGWLTLPVVVWGVMTTVRNKPIYRHSRTLAFGLLLGVAFLGNSPLFAVPLSTESFESEHRYHLPFEGEWVTTAGGEIETNYHATNPFYRWGYDFTVVRDGSRFAGEGSKLEDYHCFGEPVLAPVDGEVVLVRDARPDAAAREFDPNSILGNVVVLKVDEAEYLFVAHLKEGSVPVEEGDEVSRGEQIGACGNSGRAVEPHVHVHLQNSADFPSETTQGFAAAESLPLRFVDYLADGAEVELGMPVGGTAEEPLGERVEPMGARD